MNKVLLAVMMLVPAIVMSGCGKRNVDLNEVHQIEGTLIEITQTPQGEMTLEEFESSIYTMSVSYAGLAYVPNPMIIGLEMKDEDFLKVYNFCLDAYEKGTYSDYKEDVCDGTTYTFTYYDENGTAHVLYSVYIYNNKKLNDIINTIAYYQVD